MDRSDSIIERYGSWNNHNLFEQGREKSTSMELLEVVDRTEPPNFVICGGSPYAREAAHASLAGLALFGP